MMPAAKHGDPQMGVDIHLCIVPPSPSPVPLPTPHMSVVFDPFDYLPILGATVTVCGMKRAVAGTAGKAVHIPPGFPFAPKIPDTDDEVFMGSATVVADGDPFSFLTVPVLACQVAGMMSPPRPKQHGKKLMLLPTVVNLAIPSTVFIGGPPTISMMGMAFKLGFAALGRLAKTRFARALRERFSRWRKTKFGHLNPGFLKCKILRAEPVNIVTGAVSVEHDDFVLPGLLPIHWTRRYTSDNSRRGACGVGWETPADARLEHDAESGVVLFHSPDGAIAIFPGMPVRPGDDAAVLELMDGALLSDDGAVLHVRTKEDRIYRFPRSLARRSGESLVEYPLEQVHDLCGNGLYYERLDGRLVAIREPGGRWIELATGPDGLICRVSLRMAGSDVQHVYVEYEYDAAGNLTEVQDPLGNPYKFVYEEHLLVQHTDRAGLSFCYEYEQAGDDWRVVRSWSEDGLYAYEFSYLDAANERRITDSLGHVWLVTLDDRFLPIREVDPLGGVTTFEYDDAGRTTAMVDPDQHRAEYVYDERGNLTNLVRQDGSAISTEFDEANRSVAWTDPKGGVWTQEHDQRGLLRCSRSPSGAEWQYEYDRHGLQISSTAPGNVRTNFRYDEYGYLSAVVQPSGQVTSYRRDALGRMVEKKDALGRTWRFRHDSKGRLIEEVRPGGARIGLSYDAADNLVAMTGENGEVTQLEFTGVSELKRRIAPGGHAVEYHYDTEERLIRVTNERGETYRIGRDALGRVTEEADFWGQAWRFTYTPAGRLATMTDPLGRITRFETDPIGASAGGSGGNGQPEVVETYDYDAAGNPRHANPAMDRARL